MSSALQIALENSTSEFAPGELIRGTVVAPNAQHLQIRLRWSTQGAYFCDSEVVAISEHRNLSPEGNPIAFQLEAPLSPLSYNGSEFKIVWHIEAQASMVNGKHMTHELPIRLGGSPHRPTYR